MLLPAHEFCKPRSLRESLSVLSKNPDNSKVLGGGTDVIFNMRCHLMTPGLVLSIKDLDELKTVEQSSDGGLRIGSACRLTDLLARENIKQQFPSFWDSLYAVASRHVRNMATLGGNILLETRCWYTNQSEGWRTSQAPCFKTGGDVCHVLKASDKCVAINNADTPPALIALGATVTLESDDGQRDVLLSEFYLPDGIEHSVRRPDEILTHITIPPCPDRTVFIKQTPRKGIDFSYASIAARAGGTGIDATNVRLVLGSISTHPIQLNQACAIVQKNGLGDDAIEDAVASVREELGPLTNLYCPASYKRDIADALVRKALFRIRDFSP